jgi:toxin ParE1/3/4
VTGVAFRAEAGRDVAEAALWYEARRPGLGARFLAEIDRVVGRIAAAPLQFSEVEQGVRRALARLFPFGVYFLVEPAGSITILAVLHQHREPGAWKR